MLSVECSTKLVKLLRNSCASDALAGNDAHERRGASGVSSELQGGPSQWRKQNSLCYRMVYLAEKSDKKFWTRLTRIFFWSCLFFWHCSWGFLNDLLSSYVIHSECSWTFARFLHVPSESITFIGRGTNPTNTISFHFLFSLIFQLCSTQTKLGAAWSQTVHRNSVELKVLWAFEGFRFHQVPFPDIISFWLNKTKRQRSGQPLFCHACATKSPTQRQHFTFERVSWSKTLQVKTKKQFLFR